MTACPQGPTRHLGQRHRHAQVGGTVCTVCTVCTGGAVHVTVVTYDLSDATVSNYVSEALL
jgi:hypothetical protein